MKNTIYEIDDKSFQWTKMAFSTSQATALKDIAYHEEQLEVARITHKVFGTLSARAERGDSIEDLRLEAAAYLKARKREGLKGIRHYAFKRIQL